MSQMYYQFFLLDDVFGGSILQGKNYVIQTDQTVHQNPLLI